MVTLVGFEKLGGRNMYILHSSLADNQAATSVIAAQQCASWSWRAVPLGTKEYDSVLTKAAFIATETNTGQQPTRCFSEGYARL